jgi:hypothetical protein
LRSGPLSKEEPSSSSSSNGFTECRILIIAFQALAIVELIYDAKPRDRSARK